MKVERKYSQVSYHYETETAILNNYKSIPTRSIFCDYDFLLSDSKRICIECGNDHSFRPNFEGVKTSIDIISELQRNYNSKLKTQENAK